MEHDLAAVLPAEPAAPVSRARWGVWIKGLWIGVTAAISMVLTVVMVGPVLADMIYKASRGDVIPAVILVIYVLIGAAFYAFYGLRRSKLG